MFLKTAGGVTRGHGISLSNQAEPAQPISRVVLLASVALNCNDALLLEKVPPVAKEQRLAVASVRTAVKVRGEDVFINTNLVRW